MNWIEVREMIEKKEINSAAMAAGWESFIGIPEKEDNPEFRKFSEEACVIKFSGRRTDTISGLLQIHKTKSGQEVVYAASFSTKRFGLGREAYVDVNIRYLRLENDKFLEYLNANQLPANVFFWMDQVPSAWNESAALSRSWIRISGIKEHLTIRQLTL